MRFTLRQLSYFVAAGETGSVTRAAEQVNISQPSISAAISHLEAEFHAQFFVRHHAQGLSLTPAGKRFLPAAKQALQSAHELYDAANEATDAVSGPITVGSFRTFAPLILPDLWRSFTEKHPGAEMRIVEGDEASLIEGLHNAQIDVALTYRLHLTEDIDFVPLAELPTYALLAADHPLAARASVRLEDLAREPFVLFDLPLSRKYFLGLFEKAGIAPRIVAQTPSTAMLRSYVGSGFGFSLMTSRPLNKCALNGRPLEYVALEGPYAPMEMGLARLGILRKTRIVAAFEAHCGAEIRSGQLPGMAGYGPG